MFVGIYLSIVHKFSNKGMISSFFFFFNFLVAHPLQKKKKNSPLYINTDTHNFYEKKRGGKTYLFELVKYNSQTTKRRGWRIQSFIFYIFKARSSSFIEAQIFYNSQTNAKKRVVSLCCKLDLDYEKLGLESKIGVQS